MTRGRVMLGAGPGASPLVDLGGMFGLAPVDLRPRMDEALDCIVALRVSVTKKTSWFELCEVCRFALLAPHDGDGDCLRPFAGGRAGGGTRHGAGCSCCRASTSPLRHHVSNWSIYERPAVVIAMPLIARAGNSRCRSIWRKAGQARRTWSTAWIGYATTISCSRLQSPPRGRRSRGWMLENERAIIDADNDDRAHARHHRRLRRILVSRRTGELAGDQAKPELIAEERRDCAAATLCGRRAFNRNAPIQDANRWPVPVSRRRRRGMKRSARAVGRSEEDEHDPSPSRRDIVKATATVARPLAQRA